MAEFVEEFDSFRPPVTLMDMDPSLEIMNDFPELNSTVLDNHSLDLMCFSNDAFLSQQLESMAPYTVSSSNLPAMCPAPMSETRPEVSTGTGHCRRIKRKKEFAEVDSAIVLGSVVPPENGSDAEVKAVRKSSSCRGKDTCSGKEEKSEEVVHVRAKRGQATDRHSLAERVRREKINEKMKCLKGLVPGCYKAMGMAVMLDEIISYVQSLQKQVEFLSMKLSAASAVFDFNLDQLDAAAVMPPPLLPKVCDADDLQEVDRLMREGSEGHRTSFHPTMRF